VKLAFIGGGVMGEAIIARVVSNGLAKASDVSVCDVIESRRDWLARTHGVAVSEDAAKVAAGSDILVLAVKPHEFTSAGEALAGGLSDTQTVVSIMAGVRIDSLQTVLRHKAIVRAIPNTPAQIGEGVSVWTATAEVPAAARDAVGRLLASLGDEIYVADEKYIDMATAVTSSGPAYVFLMIEAMIDAAVHIGLRRELAAPMVLQTVLGSARYAQATGKHPAELRNQVTSPGGTTTEGVLALEDAGIRAAFYEAVEAAYEKAKQLGG